MRRLLYRFYSLMLEHLDLKDRIKSLEAELRGAAPTSSQERVPGGIPAPKPQPPSAPPAPSHLQAAREEHARGKSKAA